MIRAPVESSNLKSVGYDAATQTLEVEFKNGGVHQYAGVPAATHTKLIKSSSPGGYFHVHIRGGKFTAKKISS